MKVSEHASATLEVIDEFLAQKAAASRVDDSSDEEEAEEESVESMISAIPQELLLSLSPTGQTTPPAGFARRTRRGRTGKVQIPNGDANVVPEQRRARHICSVHLRNVTYEGCEAVTPLYFTVHPFVGTPSTPIDEVLFKSYPSAMTLVGCPSKREKG